MRTYSLLSLFLAVVLLTGAGCATQQTQNTNTATTNTSVQAEYEEETTETEDERTVVYAYMVALEDAGKTGEEIGCGDSIVAVNRPGVENGATTEENIETALTELFSITDKDYGESGLYNALYQSSLSVESVELTEGNAQVMLSGDVVSGGTCDNPRIQQQIEQTVLQFSEVTEVEIFIDETPLSELLSGAGESEEETE